MPHHPPLRQLPVPQHLDHAIGGVGQHFEFGTDVAGHAAEPVEAVHCAVLDFRQRVVHRHQRMRDADMIGHRLQLTAVHLHE